MRSVRSLDSTATKHAVAILRDLPGTVVNINALATVRTDFLFAPISRNILLKCLSQKLRTANLDSRNSLNSELTLFGSSTLLIA
jgi:hypothetical protein